MCVCLCKCVLLSVCACCFSFFLLFICDVDEVSEKAGRKRGRGSDFGLVINFLVLHRPGEARPS